MKYLNGAIFYEFKMQGLGFYYARKYALRIDSKLRIFYYFL